MTSPTTLHPTPPLLVPDAVPECLGPAAEPAPVLCSDIDLAAVGFSTPFVLAPFLVPVVRPVPTVVCKVLPHPSIFVLIDFWCHAVLRLRLYHDFCARTFEESLCPTFGALPFGAATSTQCCLYAPRVLSDLPALVEQVQSQGGTGVFVLPAAPKHGRALTFPPCKTAYKTLLECSRFTLSFTFSGPNTLPNGYSAQPTINWCACVVSFASAGSRPKRKPNRPEWVVALEPQTSGDWPVRVGDRPFGPIQVSPQPYVPQASDDVLPGGKPFPVSEVLPRPARKSRWNVPAFKELTASYPFPDVLAIALATVSDNGLPSGFAGVRSKCVQNANMVQEDSELSILRALFMKDVAKGLMAGPFSVCPYPASWCPTSQPRFSPAGLVPKNGWLKASRPEDWRPIVHHSKGVRGTDRGSQNGLSSSPLFVRFSLTANHVRDRVADFGRGVQVDLADLRAYFRMNILAEEDLHLFVYLIGEEFFADLFNCFGFRPAEWGAAAVSAVLLWGLSQPHLGIVSDTSLLDVYVDNIKFISAPSVSDHGFRFSKLCRVLEGLGCELHEFKSGPRFRSLGWDYDLDSWSFTCPIEKWEPVGVLLRTQCLQALAGQQLSVSVIEKVVGFLWWASCAAPGITPLVYTLSTCTSSVSHSGLVTLDEASLYSLFALTQFWEGWDRTRTLFHGFSPTHQAQSHVYLDASTDVGCGAWVAESGCAFSHVWTVGEILAMSRVGDGSEAKLERPSSTCAELRGFEYVLECFGESLRGQRVSFTFDSEASQKALKKGYSHQQFLLGILSRVQPRLSALNIVAVVVHVHREHNCVADALSNNSFQLAEGIAWRQHGVRLVQLPSPVPLPDPLQFSLSQQRAYFLQ